MPKKIFPDIILLQQDIQSISGMPEDISGNLISEIFIDMKAFKAYDIRGVFPGDWNLMDAYKIGFFIPRLLKTNQILVGRDIRLTSDDIFGELSKGINDAGADVLDVGLATTPMVYWATVKLNMKASVQITASHNPRDHNGLKVSSANAMPVGYDKGLNLIEKWMMEETIVPFHKRGIVKEIDLQSEYLMFMKQFIPDLTGLKITIDCSNGMAGLFIRDLLGEKHSYINENPDGRFPGHDPNPLNQENIVQLSEAVKKNDSDLGVIFDGDADRVMFLDEKGSFISPDLMIAVLGHKLLDGKPGIKVLQDIRSSKSVGEYLEKMGAEMHTWRVGRAYASPKLREIDGLFGGELAGHYYFRDFNYSDSGIMASLYILEVLSGVVRKGQTISSFIQSISNYANSGEINFVVEEKQKAILAVVQKISSNEEPLKKYDFDGVRLEFSNWWFNLRPSNTEPYLRLLAEAKEESLLQEKLHQIKTILIPFIQKK